MEQLENYGDTVKHFAGLWRLEGRISLQQQTEIPVKMGGKERETLFVSLV